jgi:hypothetical protein
MVKMVTSDYCYLLVIVVVVVVPQEKFGPSIWIGDGSWPEDVTEKSGSGVYPTSSIRKNPTKNVPEEVCGVMQGDVQPL